MGVISGFGDGLEPLFYRGVQECRVRLRGRER